MHVWSDVVTIRVIPELRADHVKRDSRLTPALTLFFGTNPDLVGTPLPPSMQKVTLKSAVETLREFDAHTLEVPEPLWVRFLPRNLLLIAIWKAKGGLGSKPRVVTFAIENNEPEQVVFGNRRVPSALQACSRVFLGAITRLSIDRIAFGSSGSRDAYSHLPWVQSIESKVIESLPVPADGASSGSVEDNRPTAAFLGVLEYRKGVRKLMAAWEFVERQMPEARLLILGDGDLMDEVDIWCRSNPDARTAMGRVAHGKVLDTLSEATVVVAPSVRDGRWREQLGLPILEGLSLGMTVVTTEETALAQWLTEHGHHVVPASCNDTALGTAIVQALTHPLDRGAVRGELPSESGRVSADRWLHSLTEDDRRGK